MKINLKPALFLSIFIIILSFGLIHLYCKKKSSILMTYNFFINESKTVNEEISLNMDISKKWRDSGYIEGKHVGAQYDYAISNKTKYSFVNYKVELYFNKEIFLDSYWNGEFTVHENKLVFVANDPPYVESNSSERFGVVLYSKQLLLLDGYSITGYRFIKIQQLLLFKILIFVSIIFFVFLIVHYRTIKYKKDLELSEKIIEQSMNTLTNFIEAKDPYTKNHSRRVAMYSLEIGHCLKLAKNKINNLYFIALMHDCGKVGIPDHVLNKKGKLTKDEYIMVQSHTILGLNMLKDFTAISDIRDGALYHHERYDGKGYPEGLKATEIPLCARIICVADSYDAMSSDRCYRKALNDEKIKENIINNSGKQFDPEITSIMINLIERGVIKKIQKTFSDS